MYFAKEYQTLMAEKRLILVYFMSRTMIVYETIDKSAILNVFHLNFAVSRLILFPLHS